MISSKKFIKKYFLNLSGALLLLLILFSGALFFFGVLINEVILEKEDGVDIRTFYFIGNHIIDPSLTPLMKWVTYFASATFLQIGYGILIVLYLLFKDYKRAVEIGIIGLGGYLVNYFMKLFFHRPRPLNPLIDPLKNFSFPSGHATSGFIFYGLLIYLIWKTNFPLLYKYLAAAFLFLFALLIGFSRIYLRVHFLTDVVAGFCVGLAWLSLVIWLMEFLKQKSERQLQRS
ncbi:MAG: phosphatase PAP2 family protein [Ferruginibacter sp.]